MSYIFTFIFFQGIHNTLHLMVGSLISSATFADMPSLPKTSFTLTLSPRFGVWSFIAVNGSCREGSLKDLISEVGEMYSQLPFLVTDHVTIVFAKPKLPSPSMFLVKPSKSTKGWKTHMGRNYFPFCKSRVSPLTLTP